MIPLAQWRLRCGLSQSALAHAAGVSLPTIQNIEAGRGNPTWEILQRIAKALNLLLEWVPAPIDWEEGSELGLPLLARGGRKVKPPTKERLERFLRTVFQAMEANPLKERELEATGALLMAIKHYYPRFYRTRIHCASSEHLLAAVDDRPKVLKLRRIALERIGEYL